MDASPWRITTSIKELRVSKRRLQGDLAPASPINEAWRTGRQNGLIFRCGIVVFIFMVASLMIVNIHDVVDEMSHFRTMFYMRQSFNSNIPRI